MKNEFHNSDSYKQNNNWYKSTIPNPKAIGHNSSLKMEAITQTQQDKKSINECTQEFGE